MISAYIVSILLTITTYVYSSTVVHKVDDFSDVIRITNEKLNNLSFANTLVLLDLDDTLVVSTECSEAEPLKKRGGLVYFEAKVRLCPAQLTSASVPSFIDYLWKEKIHFLGFTARDVRVAQDTLRQLQYRTYWNGELYPIHFPYLPEMPSWQFQFTQLSSRSQQEKTVNVTHGIAFLGGANKGQALIEYLKLYPQFHTVIFVDDHIRNIRNLENAFDGSSYDVVLIHYTEHRN